LLALVALAAGCTKGSSGPPPAPPIEVAAEIVGTAPIEVRLTAVGTIQANELVDLKPEAAGVIREIHFTEGQRVRQGDRLFVLDAAKEAAQAEQARADTDLARLSAERARTLAGTKAISQQEIDQLESQLAVKLASQKLQEERLRDMTLDAPFAGVLGPRAVSVGQYVNAGTSLATLVDDATVKITYRVPERELARLQLGQLVRLQVGAYPDLVFTGKVDLVNPVIDETTRTIQVRAVAPNPGYPLRPGMFARVETVTDRRESAVVIPERALIASLSGFSVYVITNGEARLTPVQVGTRLPALAEVTQGLAPGQSIVVSGSQKLVDGSRVIESAARNGEGEGNGDGNGTRKS
jgi:membrane fusion protein (multidrug efflux system)